VIRTLLRFTVVVLLLASSAVAADLKSPLGALDLRDGDSIVCLGDSITHQCLSTQYVEDDFYTRFSKLRLQIHNAGVDGRAAISVIPIDWRFPMPGSKCW
jgi:hypothetical protein